MKTKKKYNPRKMFYCQRPAVWDKLRRLAKKQGRSTSNYLINLIDSQ